MSLAQTLSTYVALNLMVAVGFISLRLWNLLSRHRGRNLSSASELKLHYLIMTSIVGLTILHPFFPRSEIFHPSVKLWSAESIRSFPEHYSAPDYGGYLMLPTFSGNLSLNANSVSFVLALIAIAVSLTALYRMFKDIRSLCTIRRRSFAIRKYGSVTIFSNDDIQVPFSSWTPGQSDVVIPTPLLLKHSDFKITVAHELQHHRQGDTRWVYVLWAFKVLCAANPFAYIWSQWISELQEFACDETLVDQHKVKSQQYARCLIEAAETANNQKYVPVCATGLVLLLERNLLKRRIEKMINMNTHKIKRSISLPAGLVTLALMAGVAYASNGLVQDRRVSMLEAKRLAEQAKSDSEFPIVVNDLVLKHLNRYIGTPEGREFMRLSLQRMENYRTLIEAKISAYQVPIELMAIPIIESGYQNLEERNQAGWGAGIWMFISSTARNYGLRVDEHVDERLNADLLSDAAMRYLKSDRIKFNDWLLALLSYNMGEQRVHKAIQKTASRDAWVLLRNGFENEKDYLPKLMAAIIIMKNPRSVE